MLCSTKAIVLKSFKYSDTSFVSKIYTEKFGIKSFLIRGVRKKNRKISPFVLQPLNLIEIVFNNNEKNQLHIPKEIILSPPLNSLFFDVNKSSQALFLSEILYRTIKEEVANKELFDFLTKAILLLDASPNNTANFHIVFALHLTRFLGITPLGSFSPQTPYLILKEGTFSKYKTDNPDEYFDQKLSEIIYTIMNMEIENSEEMRLSSPIRQELLKKIILYYQLHLIGFGDINSFEVLMQVFHS